MKCTSSQRVTYPCVNKLPKQSRLDHVWLVGTSVQPQPSISAVFQQSGLNRNCNNTKTFASYQSQYNFWMWASDTLQIETSPYPHNLWIEDSKDCANTGQGVQYTHPFHQYVLPLSFLSLQFTRIMSWTNENVPRCNWSCKSILDQDTAVISAVTSCAALPLVAPLAVAWLATPLGTLPFDILPLHGATWMVWTHHVSHRTGRCLTASCCTFTMVEQNININAKHVTRLAILYQLYTHQPNKHYFSNNSFWLTLDFNMEISLEIFIAKWSSLGIDRPVSLVPLVWLWLAPTSHHAFWDYRPVQTKIHCLSSSLNWCLRDSASCWDDHFSMAYEQLLKKNIFCSSKNQNCNVQHPSIGAWGWATLGTFTFAWSWRKEFVSLEWIKRW